MIPESTSKKIITDNNDDNDNDDNNDNSFPDGNEFNNGDSAGEGEYTAGTNGEFNDNKVVEDRKVINIKEIDMVKALKKHVEGEIYMYKETGAEPYRNIVNTLIGAKEIDVSSFWNILGELIQKSMNAGKLEAYEHIYYTYMQTGAFRDQK